MTSSVDSHTIPSFYACYLMRSYATASSSRTYIGSTPDPIRRKKQHNGILTQGAHKTQRGRPWETQLIIWGFPSKISALQFEWAWQKPHLSRHLRTHGDERISTVQQHVPLPLFTDTPMNQVPISEDGCKALPCTSVQSSLLVARALLRSEPFCTWSLRLTFFEEYCWAAWIRLEQALSRDLAQRLNIEVYRKVGLQDRKSRLGRPLPPKHLTPAPLCDFAGVDGSKKNLLTLNETEQTALKLEEKRAKSVQEGRSPGQWPEKLPKTLSVKAMGATWEKLKQAPMASLLNESDEGGSGYPRMKLNDEDQAELSWQRYNDFLTRNRLTMEAVKPNSSGSDSRQCKLCQSSITLQQHLTYTCCPSPYTRLQPRPVACDEPTLSQFGFHHGNRVATPSKSADELDHCDALFHIDCLAHHFTTQQPASVDYILPTHGYCPCCGVKGREEDSNTWIEVIRSVYRRKERLEKEITKAELARLREEKMLLKNSTKRKTTKASKTQSVEQEDQGVAIPKKDGLIGALDEIQGRKPIGKRSFQPVSTLLRDPMQSPASSTPTNLLPSPAPTTMLLGITAPPSSSISTAKRSSLLCNLDSLINTPSQHSAPTRTSSKRPKSTIRDSEMTEIIDLT